MGYYSYFTNEETEEQRRDMVYPNSHHKSVTESRTGPKYPDSRLMLIPLDQNCTSRKKETETRHCISLDLKNQSQFNFETKIKIRKSVSLVFTNQDLHSQFCASSEKVKHHTSSFFYSLLQFRCQLRYQLLQREQIFELRSW